MLKYIEVLRAIEYIMVNPYLKHEEGVAMLRDLRGELPAAEFAGAKKATVLILQKKITEAMEYLLEDSPHHSGHAPQAHEELAADQGEARQETVESAGDGRASVDHPVADTRPARSPARKGRAKK